MEEGTQAQWITIREAAKVTGLSESFIRTLAHARRIPSIRVGKRMYLVDPAILHSEGYLKDPRRRCYRRGNRPTETTIKKEHEVNV